MPQLATLTVSLILFWLVLSGYLKALLLALGLLSVALTVWLGYRLAVVDRESQPVHIALPLARFWVWLLGQIVLANVAVTRCVWWPRRHPIAPQWLSLDAAGLTPLQKVIYANAITMTPGTIAAEVDGDRIEVHALTAEGAEELRAGAMLQQVRTLT